MTAPDSSPASCAVFACRAILLAGLLLVSPAGIPIESADGGETVTEQQGRRSSMDYNQFIENVAMLKKGQDVDTVLRTLGEPDRKDPRLWIYDMTRRKGFPGLPPPIGQQVFTEVGIVIEGGKVVRVQMGWIDAAGPGPSK